MPRLLQHTLTVCGLLATGCYTSVEQTRARHEFRGSFDCPSAAVAPSPHGYRVEGCGTTAFYRCDASPPRYDARFETPHGGSDRDRLLLDVLFEGIGDAIKAPGKCELVSAPPPHHELQVRARPSAEAAPQVVQALAEPEPADSRTLTVLFAGGQLVLSADPSGSPDYLGLRVESPHPVFYEPCTPWLLQDGRKLVVTALRVVSSEQVQLVLPSRSLSWLHKGSRFDAQVCGLRFTLDAAERAQVADFVHALMR
jgi:hypothetical protein